VHLTFGIEPGDGRQTVWARALGEYRNKYFHYTQQKITAAGAKMLGLVAEVLPDKGALINGRVNWPKSCWLFPG